MHIIPKKNHKTKTDRSPSQTSNHAGPLSQTLGGGMGRVRGEAFKLSLWKILESVQIQPTSPMTSLGTGTLQRWTVGSAPTSFFFFFLFFFFHSDGMCLFILASVGRRWWHMKYRRWGVWKLTVLRSRHSSNGAAPRDFGHKNDLEDFFFFFFHFLLPRL